jgi:hypothetical protein
MSASEKFRFRFVARGEQTNALVLLAVKSLQRCHPSAAVVVVDANDQPALAASSFDDSVRLIHLTPGDDAVARAVGRGTRHHLFYWRHSPQLLRAIGRPARYDVHADADIVFLRPMDLTALLGPLSRGRIAAAVDESTLDYYRQLELTAAGPAAGVLPAAGAGGPLLQAGLLFTNPADDGELYEHFWEYASTIAKGGHLLHVPSDDMCLLATLLGQAGPCWERLLMLGHEWNYITDAEKDPGIFGCAAHYGGRKAKALVLESAPRLFPPAAGEDGPWGTVQQERGPWNDRDGTGAWRVPLPFCLTWRVPYAARCVHLSVANNAAVYVYVDGYLIARLPPDTQRMIPLSAAETVTLLGMDSGAVASVAVTFGGAG